MRLASSPIEASVVFSKAVLLAITLLRCQLSTALVVRGAPGVQRDAPLRSQIIPRAEEGGTLVVATRTRGKYKCKTRNPSWECLKADITFPTVECLKKDMRTCGIVGAKTIFDSFGDRTDEVTPFRDQKEGVMFDDAMEDDWWRKMHENPTFQLRDPSRQRAFIARFIEAMAEMSRGEVYLAVPGDIITIGGAYASPNNRKHTFWHDLWFPRLQRNPLVTRVTLVDITTKEHNQQTFPQHEGWLPSDKRYPELQYNQQLADDLLEGRHKTKRTNSPPKPEIEDIKDFIFRTYMRQRVRTPNRWISRPSPSSPWHPTDDGWLESRDIKKQADNTLEPRYNKKQAHKIFEFRNTTVPADEIPHPRNITLPADEISQPRNTTLPADEISHPRNTTLPADEISHPRNITLPADEITHPRNITLPADEISHPRNITLPADEITHPRNITLPADEVLGPGNDRKERMETLPKTLFIIHDQDHRRQVLKGFVGQFFRRVVTPNIDGLEEVFTPEA
ncbi:MAG: hypothetical protein M1823_003778 [Watsoniomyces obsoletus]|nr:MAG: hypothetical protein M1823_003778 [Watsoniomyces obsoletus]